MRLACFRDQLPPVKMMTELKWEEDLTLYFEWEDPENHIQLPAPKAQNRFEKLYDHTCLEAFFHVHVEGKSAYWEFNQSPTGGWNFYAFDSYRSGMREATCSPPLLEKEKTQFSIQLTGLPFEKKDIKAVALTAVLMHKDKGPTYWAFDHPPEKADFHAPQGLVALESFNVD